MRNYLEDDDERQKYPSLNEEYDDEPEQSQPHFSFPLPERIEGVEDYLRIWFCPWCAAKIKLEQIERREFQARLKEDVVTYQTLKQETVWDEVK